MSEYQVTLTITIPEDAIRHLESFIHWSTFDTYLRTSPARDVETATELKYALKDILDALKRGEVQP